MNRLEYYDRQKVEWDEAEIQRLRNEYEEQKLTISKIGDLHRRTPGSISYKLKNIGLVQNTSLARGYEEYRASNLYKEILNKPETPKVESREKKERKPRKNEEILAELQKITGLLTELVSLQKNKVEVPKKIVVKPKPMFVDDN